LEACYAYLANDFKSRCFCWTRANCGNQRVSESGDSEGEEIILSRKISKERALRDAGGLRDLLNRGLIETILGEQIDSSIEDCFSYQFLFSRSQAHLHVVTFPTSRNLRLLPSLA